MLRITATALLLAMLCAAPASAETRRSCSEINGTRTCTTVTVKTQTTRIYGISAQRYIRGLRAGKCMPSPSGACGGE